MPLTKEQIQSLFGMITSADTDDSDCGSCFDHLAEFAELELRGKEIPDALRAVEKHIQQCACCRGEYDALMAGLRAMEEE